MWRISTRVWRVRTDANRSRLVRRFEMEAPESDYSLPADALVMNIDVCAVVGVGSGNGAAIARKFAVRLSLPPK